MEDEKLMTVAEVAKWLVVSEETVRNWTRKGRVSFFKAGAQLRFRRADVAAMFEVPADAAGLDRPGVKNGKVEAVEIDGRALYIGGGFPSSDPEERKKVGKYRVTLERQKTTLLQRVHQEILEDTEAQKLLKKAGTVIANARKLKAQIGEQGVSLGAMMEQEAADFTESLQQVQVASVAMGGAAGHLRELRAAYLTYAEGHLAQLGEDAQQPVREAKLRRELWRNELLEMEPGEAAGRKIQLDALDEQLFDLEVIVHAAQHLARLDPAELRLPALMELDGYIAEAEALLPTPATPEKPTGREKPAASKPRPVSTDSRLAGKHSPRCQCAVCAKAREGK